MPRMTSGDGGEEYEFWHLLILLICLIALASQGLQHSEQVWSKLTGKSGIQTGKEGQCNKHRHFDFYIVSSVRSSSGYHGLLEIRQRSSHFFRFFKFFRF